MKTTKRINDLELDIIFEDGDDILKSPMSAGEEIRPIFTEEKWEYINFVFTELSDIPPIMIGYINLVERYMVASAQGRTRIVLIDPTDIFLNAIRQSGLSKKRWIIKKSGQNEAQNTII